MRLTEAELAKVAKKPTTLKRFRLTAATRPEADILTEVMEALWRHPQVCIAGRYNSGAFSRVEENGRRAFYRFVTLYSAAATDYLKAYFPRFDALRRARLKHPDILGMLKGGRLFALECKRTGVKPMAEQQAFLDLIVAHGGVAGVVYSGAEAIAIIDAACQER